ncbi:MAG: T9SS C-terminal target domain-containing protein [Bacteroidetes bacterium]|nr:MAG: T9SS C-terminal target domain-containing protein [Bacteroidota bacterium]
MNNKATLILSILINLLAGQMASAQQMYLQTATSAGGTSSGSGGSASYAIGQAFYVKNTGSGGVTSQGVIQLLSGSSDPLPITLLSFTAVYNPADHAVDLTWYTTAEINNDFFTIERSQDGLQFLPIGYVDGAGNSNTLMRYDFKDQQPLPGISYYRLKQTDYDGSFDFSQIVAVSINEQSIDLTIYPNPASQYINIRLDNPNSLENSWELLSLNGRLVKRGSFNGEQETLFLADLPDGTWLLRIYRKGFSATLKIIKK